MSVLDSSAALDLLLDQGSSREVRELLSEEQPIAAPDLLVFEVLAVLRRHVGRGVISADRGSAAVRDLGDLAVELFPTLPLCDRAWEVRQNMTAADGLFIALAELLGQPLVTKDSRLAAAARSHTAVDVIELTPGP